MLNEGINRGKVHNAVKTMMMPSQTPRQLKFASLCCIVLSGDNNNKVCGAVRKKVTIENGDI